MTSEKRRIQHRMHAPIGCDCNICKPPSPLEQMSIPLEDDGQVAT